MKCLLTAWCRVLKKLTGLLLVKKFPAFHGTQRFVTALTSIRHLSLSWASPMQSIYPYPTFWRSILILSTLLCLGVPSGLLPCSFPSKTLYIPLSSPIHATCPAHCMKYLNVQNSIDRKRDFDIYVAAFIFKTKFLSQYFQIILRAQCIFKFLY